MNKEREKIFDAALSELKKGASLEEAVLKCQPDQQNLAEDLALAQQLSLFPKKSVPHPAMQRKYALAPVKIAWYNWLHFTRLAAVSMGLTLFLSAGLGTGFAAYHSIPGQALFAVKKTTQNLQLQFAGSSEKKIALQVEFSKKRLEDLKKVLDNPKSSRETATAVVKELSEQTKNTLETVSFESKLSKKDLGSGIVKTLETIAVDQEKLAKEAKAGTTKEIAANIENNIRGNVEDIKHYILIASNEAESANIPPANTSPESEKETISSTTPAAIVQLNTEKSTSSSSTVKSLILDKVPEPETIINPNAVSAGFIPESPLPEYAP